MRKLIIFSLAIALGLGNFFVPITSASENKVCGVDGVTYTNAAAATTAGVSVSYTGPCTVVTRENTLYEENVAMNFAGALIEIGTTELPTTLIVENNDTKVHYTVEALATTSIRPIDLLNWIPGDQVRVVGNLNKNTQTITANSLFNLSFIASQYDGFNGWITAIDKTASTFTYTWDNLSTTIKVSTSTRIVSGLKNPATLADLKVGDRVRGRVFANTTDAKIVVVLRRGENLFMKIRTFVPNVELVRLSSTVVPTTIQVKIIKTPGLKKNDVNNLIGTEGALITVNVTEDTILTRKYFGRTTLAEFQPGDNLRIVGRVNDDGTIDAKLIKDNSIWQVNMFGHVGIVQSVNASSSYIEIAWHPIKYKLGDKIKDTFDKKQRSMEGQMVAASEAMNKNDLASRLRERLQKLSDQFQAKLQETRERVVKKIDSDRINRSGLTLGDVIEVMPTRLMRVNISSSTEIRIGDNTDATIGDIKAEDRVLVRGVRRAGDNVIDAKSIVVLPSLPELDDSLDTDLDDVNDVVEEYATHNSTSSTLTDIEVEIED
jgi:hypothetical protein